MRSPVAVKIALHTAGKIGGKAGLLLDRLSELVAVLGVKPK
jgi:hypothetical protein